MLNENQRLFVTYSKLILRTSKRKIILQRLWGKSSEFIDDRQLAFADE
jgi:hypothetical protein